MGSEGPRGALPISAVGQSYELVCLQASLGHLPSDARSGPLVGRRERHFFSARQGKATCERCTPQVSPLADQQARSERVSYFFLALGEPRRASAIVSTMPQTN